MPAVVGCASGGTSAVVEQERGLTVALPVCLTGIEWKSDKMRQYWIIPPEPCCQLPWLRVNPQLLTDSALEPNLSGGLAKLQNPGCCFWFLAYTFSTPAGFPCRFPAIPVPCRLWICPLRFQVIAQKSGKSELSKEKLIIFISFSEGLTRFGFFNLHFSESPEITFIWASLITVFTNEAFHKNYSRLKPLI